MLSPVEFNAEWASTVIIRPLVALSLHVVSWDDQNRPLFCSVDSAFVPPLTLTMGRPPVGKGGGRWAYIDERMPPRIGCRSSARAHVCGKTRGYKIAEWPEKFSPLGKCRWPEPGGWGFLYTADAYGAGIGRRV